MRKFLALVLSAVSTALFSFQAWAVSVVPAGTITTLTTDGTDTLTAVGGAMIGLAAVAVLFKWGKAAIFG